MTLSLTVCFTILLLVGGTDARILGKQRQPKPTKQDIKSPMKKKPVPLSADKQQQGKFVFNETTMENLPEAPKHSAPIAVAVTDTERKINNVRITLTGVKEMAALTPAEVLFFEDSFMLAFLEAQSSGNGAEHVHARSLMVFGEPTESQNGPSRGNPDDRSLTMRTTSTYFDIFALFEWSCYLCGASHNDDDYVPVSRPTAPRPRAPTPAPAPKRTATHTTTTAISVRRNAHPTRAADLADDVTENNGLKRRDFSDHDDDSGRDDDLTDDRFSFSGSSPIQEDEEWGLQTSLDSQDDDAFTLFFGNRQLSTGNGYEEDQFESLLCARLRAGPFPAFYHVGECLAIFSD